MNRKTIINRPLDVFRKAMLFLLNGFTLRYFLDFYRLSGEKAAFFSRARWFDLLMGTDSVRKAILKGESEEAIRNSWQKELQDYKEIRKKYLLYE